MKRLLLVLCLIPALCFAADEYSAADNISGATVYGTDGTITNFEIATEDATVTWAISYKRSGSWAAFQPTRGDATWTVFAGFSDKASYRAVAPADSSRVIVTPAAATDVTVRMW